MKRLATLLIVFAFACGGDSVFDTTTTASPAATTTTTTETTTTTSSSTTTTTTSSSTTTTTTSSTTTTEPPPPATNLVTGNICILGWSDPSGWVDDFDNADVPVVGGEAYQVVLLDDPVGVSIGGPPQSHCDPLDLVNVPLEPPLPGTFGTLGAIAVQANWNVRPHVVAELGTADPTYADATRDILESRGIADPEVVVKRVVRADLEGDGVDEVIVVAGNIGVNEPAEVGDYAMVFMRKLIEGEVQTAIIVDWIITEPIPEDWIPFIDNYDLAAVADLDGDGKMEIVVEGAYYEGAFLLAYEYVDDDLGPDLVLSCGCGV